MLKSLEIENYRLFSRYRVGDLSRVNLLVGKNSCGKSTLLEAAQFLLSGGNPSLLSQTALRRGEALVLPPVWGRDKAVRYPLVSHFFHGHRIAPDAYFRVGGKGMSAAVTVRAVAMGGARDEAEHTGPLALRLEGGKHPPEGSRFMLPVTREGAITSDLVTEPRLPLGWIPADFTPVDLVCPESLAIAAMRAMWDKAVKATREPDVEEAIRILDPDVQRVLFLSQDEAYSQAEGGILLESARTRQRSPLGTYGAGMQRMLGLALALVQEPGGALMIDEIDAGLHYSIQGDMWRLVVESARKADVQVFATTHSLDCVRGLAWLCENYPELGREVSLQKIDPALEEAVDLRAEQITLAVEQGIEVR